MVFNFFLFRLSLSVQEKIKNSIYEIPKFPFTLNINNKRTTSAELINLGIVRKLIKYVVMKAMFTLSNIEILLLAGKSVL